MIAGTFRAVLNAAGCIRAEGLFMMKDCNCSGPINNLGQNRYLHQKHEQ